MIIGKLTQMPFRLNFLCLFSLLFTMLINLLGAYTYPGWFDEVYMAEIVYNLSNYGNLIPTIFVNHNTTEELLYGPVFFYIQSFFSLVFGFNCFTYRVVGLLFTFLSCLNLLYLAKFLEIPRISLYVYFFILLFDPVLNRGSIVGRNDSCSLFFITSGLLFFLKYQNLWPSAILVGISSSLAFLSTPRSIFVLIGLFCFVLIKNFIYKPLSKFFNYFVVLILSFVTPMAWYIYSKFWSLSSYLQVYSENPSTLSHIGFGFEFGWYEFIGAISLLYFIAFDRNCSKIPILVSIFISWLLFSMFVVIIGPYKILICPFVLLFVIICTSNIFAIDNKKIKLFWYLFFGFILCSGTSFCIARAIDISIFNLSSRDQSSVSKFIKLHINKPSLVAFNFEYYFLFRGQKSFDNYSLVSIESIPDSNYLIKNNIEWLVVNSTWPDIHSGFLYENFIEVAQYPCPSPYFFSRRNYVGTKIYQLKAPVP